MDETPSVGKMVGCGFLVFVAIIVCAIGAWAFDVGTAEIRGRGNAHKEIYSSSHRIEQYNHFFDLCVSVQNAETNIDIQSAALQNGTTETAKALAQQNINANLSARENGIHTYNQDALNHYTSGQFLASNLPYQLSDEPYKVGGTKTQCAAS
jgi:hypothetical protein